MVCWCCFRGPPSTQDATGINETEQQQSASTPAIGPAVYTDAQTGVLQASSLPQADQPSTQQPAGAVPSAKVPREGHQVKGLYVLTQGGLYVISRYQIPV
jgi:hypothetical protein